jgi:predicted Zn-dependent peptidase
MYEERTLSNGVRIIVERLPFVRSVAMGIWVGTGSRYERACESGASHFIEHMLFKGTETRSAAALANLMDGVGGQINAFTTKECTCFYGRVLDTHLPQLADVLCDMFFNSRFDETDVENERGVVFEEIDMYEDTPEDLVVERLYSAVLKGNALGRPILGSKRTLSQMTGTSLRRYMQDHYSPDCVIVVLSGSFQDADIDAIAAKFASMPVQGGNHLKMAEYKPAVVCRRKGIEQNHLCLTFPGLRAADERRFAMQMMTGILGGGMSSRLFQSVREKNGLCYSICAFGSGYIDMGLFSICTALSKETEQKALRLIIDEVRRFRDEGVTAEELRRAREQIKANVIMSLESTGARMNSLGRNMLYLGYIPDADEMIRRYDQVTAADIAELAASCLRFDKMSFSAVGRTDPVDEYRERLAGMIKN